MGHRVTAGKGSTLLTHFSSKVHMAEFPMLEGKQGDFTVAGHIHGTTLTSLGWREPNGLQETQHKEGTSMGALFIPTPWSVGKRLWAPLVGDRLCAARVIL